jgi:hypothetical protein
MKKTFIEDIIEPCPMRQRTPLPERHPEIAATWCYEKNCGFGPEDFSYGSGIYAWWVCPTCKLSWQTKIATRTSSEANCPYCASNAVADFNSLEEKFPQVAKEWHVQKNKKLTASQVTAKSGQVVWWQCVKDAKHEWKSPVSCRTTREVECPFCSGRRVSGTNSLKAMSPKLAREWHPNKNGKLKPADVTSKSKHKVWWRCADDERHEWEADPFARWHYGNGCPYCVGKRVNKSNSLATLLPELAKQWHDKNRLLTPNDVTIGSGKLVWWKCSKNPKHSFQATVIKRALHSRDCPYCAGQEVDSTNSLKTRFPKLAKQWHPNRNGDLTAANVTAGSKKKVWWQCPANANHEWEAVIKNRTGNGTGCPTCYRNSR